MRRRSIVARAPVWAPTYRVNPGRQTRRYTITRTLFSNFVINNVGTFTQLFTFDPFGTYGSNSGSSTTSIGPSTIADTAACASLFSSFRVNYITCTFRVTGNGTSSDQTWPQYLYAIQTDPDMTTAGIAIRLPDLPGTRHVQTSQEQRDFKITFRPKVQVPLAYIIPTSISGGDLRRAPFTDINRRPELFGLMFQTGNQPAGFTTAMDLTYSISFKNVN